MGQLGRIHLGQVPAARFHALLERLAIADHAALDHLSQQVVSLTGTLTYAGEDREAVILLGDIVNQLHDQDRFAYTRAAEEADLSTLGVGLQEVNHLDAGVEHLLRGGQFLKFGGLPMDGQCAIPA